MASVAYSYDDKAVREDLLNVLTNLSPTDTQLVTGLGTSTAMAQRHEWLTDTLSSVKDNSYAEGADASYPTVTNPSRYINYTQIMRQGYSVSDTERAVNTAAFNDRLAYQATKALKMLKNDMEYAVMRGSLACGASGVTGQMKGVKSWLNLVTAQSGISLTELQLNDYLQNVWAAGTEVNAIYCPMYIKRKISAYTANATKNVDIVDRRLVNAVDVYEADAAKLVKLFAHRHVSVAADNNYDIVGLNEDMWKVAYLRKPFNRPLAKTGDAEKAECLTEVTLECLHEDAGFLAQAQL